MKQLSTSLINYNYSLTENWA